MSVIDAPGSPAGHAPVTHQRGVTGTHATAGARALAVLRIVMGLLFIWPFLDKTFGWGYATASKNAWVNGGSPTKGFLSTLDHGPFMSMFHSWAGAVVLDWLFMLGLLGIGAALLLGIGLRLAAAAGSLLLIMMWAAEWPLAQHTSTGGLTRSTNPLFDDHIVFLVVIVVLAMLYAGNTWGLGRRWANLPFVQRNRWLI